MHHGINCCLHSEASLYEILELSIFIPFVLLMISHFYRKFFLRYQLIFLVTFLLSLTQMVSLVG